MAETMAQFLEEQAQEERRAAIHWSQRAHRAEDLLREWVKTPFFSTEAAWRSWRDEYVGRVRRVLDEADEEDMPTIHESAGPGTDDEQAAKAGEATSAEDFFTQEARWKAEDDARDQENEPEDPDDAK